MRFFFNLVSLTYLVDIISVYIDDIDLFYSSNTNVTIDAITINFVIQELCILQTKEKNDTTI